MSSRKQPAWKAPSTESAHITGLKVSNSMTNNKDLFVPRNGKQVKWYICGPTVYDSSHLGHARTYLSFDIIRRIMEDYFGYDIHVCMNITDIDDKIITGARTKYLYDEYVQKVAATGTLPESEIVTLQSASSEHVATLRAKKNKIEKEIESKVRTAKEAGPELDLATVKCEAAEELLKRVAVLKAPIEGDVLKSLLQDLKTALGEFLDGREAESPTLSHELLNKLTKRHSAHYEAEYLADMKALGIKTPDTLTRVTEYVPEIIEMCEKIIKNGYGYESAGSIYFDVAAFDAAKNHHYAKLNPNAYGNQELLDEGEGKLSTGGEKRSPNDFALWKKSKPGEPAWPSPWGLGRPGWHIECSAMAGFVLGDELDIHAGGFDLKFPHHDNELAQSEAYFDNDQWVNYFLHTGHLHIDGLKMSKSLKNFITIREMLDTCTARQARLLFLSQPWDNNMNYQRVDTMKEVSSREKYLNEYFLRVESVLGERALAARTTDGYLNEHWSARDLEFNKFIITTQAAVHEALCDNFDTATVMRLLYDVVNKANVYMEKNTEKKAFLLKKSAVYVTRILRVFGVVEGAQEFGLDQASSSASSGMSERDIARPYVQALVDFRKAVRALAKTAGPAAAELLKATDALRDEIMPNLDVKISDDSEFGFVFQNREELLAERRERLAAEESARKSKLTAQLAGLQSDLKKLIGGMESPQDAVARQRFVVMTSADDPIPETDTRGEKILKSAAKDIKKIWTNQAKAHAAYQAKIAASPNAIADLEEKIAKITAQLQN